MKNNLAVPQTVHLELPCDPAFPLSESSLWTHHFLVRAWVLALQSLIHSVSLLASFEPALNYATGTQNTGGFSQFQDLSLSTGNSFIHRTKWAQTRTSAQVPWDALSPAFFPSGPWLLVQPPRPKADEHCGPSQIPQPGTPGWSHSAVPR